MTDRSGWTQRRLQSTEAYLRHTVNEGRRDVYDAEEHRLLLLDVRQEIDRRKAGGTWVTKEKSGTCPCNPDDPRPKRPGFKYCHECLSIASAMPGYREEDFREG